MTMCNTWERYGIHALEAVYPMQTQGGWLDVVNSGDDRQNIVHIRHDSGVQNPKISVRIDVVPFHTPSHTPSPLGYTRHPHTAHMTHTSHITHTRRAGTNVHA